MRDQKCPKWQHSAACDDLAYLNIYKFTDKANLQIIGNELCHFLECFVRLQTNVIEQ